jgi:hypothetical protein
MKYDTPTNVKKTVARCTYGETNESGGSAMLVDKRSSTGTRAPP